MLGSLFGWVSLLFEPLAFQVPLIEPQPRLKSENGIAIPVQGPWQDIITGHYAVPPVLKIHDRNSVVKWSWQREDVTQPLPPLIRSGLYSGYNDATDMKWMRGGRSVAAVYSALVVVINHTPDQPSTDKKITFAINRANDVLHNAHTIEPLPGDRLAVGTTGQRPWDGILVYNMSEALPLMDEPPVLQKIEGLRAIHALIWDEQGQMLWATGTDAAADGSDPVPAYGVIQGYPFDAETGLLSIDEAYRFKFPEYFDIDAEWGHGYSWWAGPHDLVPVPNERVLLVSNDIGLHAFDINEMNFTAEYDEVVEKYMPGFEVTTNDRHGINRQGEYVELPQSDLKGFSLAPDGSFLYTQSLWRLFRGNYTSLVVDGVRHQIMKGNEIYRSRWFGDIDGWPKPKT
ncbi:hypothetical protein N7489_002267 [Penicillium chrysogenum]|jgi:hypothetical protein|uniref:Methanethiol oxidase n=1 Tax=Penicillium chrysogenum TaxID=5076 RepID=A0ABQ8WM91_PENCH|nr:uncharacterized protein N7489_002267 [Penicillium chrysogenum]KAJ5248402.1 hypothetical protein N7524_012362 [Penicillium chrysogenum]KAJ5251857.1 hypothetical protein N7489_002267 [Penicillium chrysogenum]KAJ5270765.1 hypothetical protein N7505_006523 [Penicillium chrysogenum]KAJ6146483.1 hypothetical protein N7497_008465 [Penicillium chrysogenum]